MSKSDIVKAWYDEVWVQGDPDAIGRYFSDAAQASGIIQGMDIGITDFQELVAATRELIQDIEIDVPHVIEADDWAAAVLSMRARRSDTLAPVTVTGQVMARFQGDRMVEAHNQIDYVALFEQLDQFPANTLPLCLAGQRLGWA